MSTAQQLDTRQPTRPTPFQQLLGTRTSTFLELVARVNSSPTWDEDLVHDVRVAGRRMAATLKVLKWSLPDRAMAVRKRVQSATRVLGKLRDLDVLRGHLRELASATPDSTGEGGQVGLGESSAGERLAPCSAIAEAWFHSRRRRLERDARHRYQKELGSGTTKQLLALPSSLEQIGPDERSEDSRVAFHEHVLAVVRAFFREAHRVGPASGPDELHKLRMAGKKMRYTLEFASCLNPHLDAVLPLCQKLQGLLGTIHDYDVLREFVGELPGIAAEQGVQLSALDCCDELARRCEQARARCSGEFHARWDAWAWDSFEGTIMVALTAA